MISDEDLEPVVRVLAIGVQGFRNRRPQWTPKASNMWRYVMTTIYPAKRPPSASLTFVRKGSDPAPSSYGVGNSRGPETVISFNYNPSKKRWSTENISGVRLETISQGEVEKRVASFYSTVYPVQRVDGESLRYAKLLIDAERRILGGFQAAADRIAPRQR